jgi:hypothetical protein
MLKHIVSHQLSKQLHSLLDSTITSHFSSRKTEETDVETISFDLKKEFVNGHQGTTIGSSGIHKARGVDNPDSRVGTFSKELALLHVACFGLRFQPIRLFKSVLLTRENVANGTLASTGFAKEEDGFGFVSLLHLMNNSIQVLHKRENKLIEYFI